VDDMGATQGVLTFLLSLLLSWAKAEKDSEKSRKAKRSEGNDLEESATRASSELVRDSPSDLSLIKKISLSEPGKNPHASWGGRTSWER